MSKKIELNDFQGSQEQHEVPQVRKAVTGRLSSYRQRLLAMQKEIAARAAAKDEGVPMPQQSVDGTLVDVRENQHSLNSELREQSSQNENEDLGNIIRRQPKVPNASKASPSDCVITKIVTSPTTENIEISYATKNNESTKASNLLAHAMQETLLDEEVILLPQNSHDRLQSIEQGGKFSEIILVKSNAHCQKEYQERNEMEKQRLNPKDIPKTNAQRQQKIRKQDSVHREKTYRDKLNFKRQDSELNSSLPMDENQRIASTSFEVKKKPGRRQDKCEGLIGNQLQKQTKQVKPSMKKKTQQQMSSSTRLYQDSYKEHNECSIPKVLLRQDTYIARDVFDTPTTNADRCKSYSDHNQTGKILYEQRRLSASAPSNILDSEKRVMTLEPSFHKGIIRLKKKMSYNKINQVGEDICISSSTTPSQESEVITKLLKSEAMTSKEWSVENLTLYAFTYIFDKSKITTTDTVDTSLSYEGLPRWREFRKHLFDEIRRRVQVVVSAGRHPEYALKDLVAISKLAHRFNLLKLALQIEACALDGPVCAWAIRQLVIQLAHAVDRQCRKVDSTRPRLLTARALVSAVFALRNMGVNVKCTKEQLVCIWQRLCALKTWQLYKLSRAGDRPNALPHAERLDAHDWSVLDTLLLHDNNQKMELVTMSSLQSLEFYRALVVLVRLQMKLPLWVRRAPPWRYVGFQGWARVHARYNSTGRTASIILLQRRWYQLRLLTRTALEEGVKPLHPLLKLVVMEFPSVIKENKNNWRELVRSGNCNLVADENIAKQEAKRPWYYDIAILENLETVKEIDEYISQRIDLTFCQEKHKCGLWEQCDRFETCKSNEIGNVRNALDSKVDDRKRTENNIACSNISETVTVETLEALERIDPTTAQVTIVVDNDSDEAVYPEITSVKDSSTIKTQENELRGTRDICDESQSNKRLRAVEKLTSPNNDMPLDITGRENKEASEPQATFKRESEEESVEKDSLDTKTDEGRMGEIENNDNFDTCIDNKLLYMTYLKLTRIDETPAWVKHAKNNNINLRRAGLLEINDSTIDDSGITNDFKDKIKSETGSIDNTIFKGVSENVLRNRRNQKFLKLCKPAVVRLRKLRDSEIPRKGRIVKKVELPDIDEVRRINSNILTAQVKPISLTEQKEDSMSDKEEPGNSSETKFMKLSKELRLLHKDMQALFILQPMDQKAIIHEAINSDENKLYLFETQTESDVLTSISSNVLLDEDELMLHDDDQRMPVHTKRNQKKKNKVEKVMKSIAEPIRLNAYEEWERQKHIANKYFEFGNKTCEQGNKKSKSKAVKESRSQKPSNVSAELAQTEQEIVTLSTQSATVSQPRLTEKTHIIQSAASNHCKLVPARNDTERYQNVLPRPPITIVNTSNQNNLQHLLTDNFLTKLLNAPPKEPSVDNLRYMILSPMEKTNQFVKVNDIINLMAPVEVEDENPPVLTPMITGVCSLAETETIEDNAAAVQDIEMMESVTSQNNGNCDAGGRNNDPNLTMCLTPTHRNIMVKVGDQLVCNTTEASSNKVSSSPNNEEPVAPAANQTLLQKFLMCPSVPPKPKFIIKAYPATKANGQGRLQKAKCSKGRKRGKSAGDSHTNPENSAFNVEGGKYCGTAVSTNKKKRRCYGPLPHIGSELKTEFTTPEEYIKADRRKLLTVVKLDLWDPAWVIGGKYVILTEQNLPCSYPGYWTIGRDPPGRCQFLLWPKNVQSTMINELNENSHSSTGVSVTKYTNVDGKVSNIVQNVGEVIVNEQDNIIQSSINVCENIEEETFLSNKQNSEVLAPNCLENSKVVINQQRHVLYEDDSDSDSESNRLQIVEEDITDFNNADPTTSNFHNSGMTERHNNNSEYLSKKEDNLIRAEQNEHSNTVKVVDKNNLVDHTYSKSKDTDTNTNKSKGMIKVKSFASISRMETINTETLPLTQNINGSPDVIEKENKFYKKLLEPSSTDSTTTYALMLSAVTNPKQCDSLLREGWPLQVLERYQGRVQPLKVSRGEPGGPIYLSHYDSHFLNDLVHRLRDFNANYVQMYECEILD